MVIKGERINLRTVSIKDADMILRWRNSDHIARNSYCQRAISRKEHLKWMDNILKDKTRVTFIIVLNNSSKSIGKIGLKNVDLVNKKAELEKMIGEKDEQGKGYVTEAAKLFLNYTFTKLKINKIYAHVFKHNIANINVNKKLGFKIEGYFRKHVCMENKFIDIVYMGLLREDFNNIRMGEL